MRENVRREMVEMLEARQLELMQEQKALATALGQRQREVAALQEGLTIGAGRMEEINTLLDRVQPAMPAQPGENREGQ